MEVRVETLESMRYRGILGPGCGIGVEDPMLAPPPELQSLVECKQKTGRSFSICEVPLYFSKPDGTEACECNGGPYSHGQSWQGNGRRALLALINNSFSRSLLGRQQSKQLKLEAFQVIVEAPPSCSLCPNPT